MAQDWFYWEYARMRQVDLLGEFGGGRRLHAGTAIERVITRVAPCFPRSASGRGGLRGLAAYLLAPEDSASLPCDLRADMTPPGWRAGLKTIVWIGLTIGSVCAMSRVLG